MGLMAWLTGRSDALAAPPGSRQAAWEAALRMDGLPSFVADRLDAARSGRTPWTSTGSPAELLLIRRHGLRPVATVSGTCWFKSGWRSFGSPDYWGQAQMEGWGRALARLQTEAVAAGAHAVVDTRLRQGMGTPDDREYTLLGTAIRIDGISVPAAPAVTTLSALATARLLLAGIVPACVAVGAASGWLRMNVGGMSQGLMQQGLLQQGLALDGRGSFTNRPLQELTEFAARIRTAAIHNLIDHARPYGNHILAQDVSSDLERIERDKQPPDYFARSMAIGTVLDAAVGSSSSLPIDMALQMNDTVISGAAGFS